MNAAKINKTDLQRGAAYFGASKKVHEYFPSIGRAISYMSIELQRLEKEAAIEYAMLSPEGEGYLLLLSYKPYCLYDMETIIDEEGKRKRLYRFDTAAELQAMVDREYYEGATYEGGGKLLYSSDTAFQLVPGITYRIMLQKEQLGTACYTSGKWEATMRLRRR